MNKTIFGVPRVIVVIFVIFVAPILAAIFLSHEDTIARQIALEKACAVRVLVQSPVEVTPTPSATPSPTLRPRFFPAVSPATGGAK